MKKKITNKLNNLSDLMPLIYEAEMDQIYQCLNSGDEAGAYAIFERQIGRRAQKHREEIQVVSKRVCG